MATKKRAKTKKNTQNRNSTKTAARQAASNESEGFILDKVNAALAWIKLNPLLFFLGAIAITGLLWLGYVTFVKWQYAQAEKEVNKLSSAVIAELGTPDKTDLLKSCSYQSTKNIGGEGFPACNVRVLLTYSVSNVDEATEVAKKVTDITAKMYTITHQTQPRFNEEKSSLLYTSAENNYEAKGFDCSNNIEYQRDATDQLKESEVQILISCGKSDNIYRIFPEV